MAKRESVESKIISYFSEESDEKVNLLFGIVKGIVAKRAPKKQKAKPVLAKPAERAKDDVRAAFTMDSKAS